MIVDPWRIAADRINPPPSPVADYYHDPAGFATDLIKWPHGEALTVYQAEILDAIPAHGRVSARGPHGLGKTGLTAMAVLWFAITRDAAGRDWKVPATAGVWRQLQQYLWPEIHKWARRLRWDLIGRPPFSERTELLDLNLKLDFGSAFAAASDQPAMIEGAHADSILYVFDEAKTIQVATFDAAEGAFSGAGPDTPAEAYALAVSTPGEPAGRFYDIHRRAPGLSDWWVRHVTLDEAITAGRVSRDWADKRAEQWGADSAVYANRVLGEFHSSDEDGVIPLSWVEAAIERWRTWDTAGRPGRAQFVRPGVDVARSGSDQTVIAPRFDWVIDELRYTKLEDTMATTGRVKGLLDVYGNGEAVVDVIGIGAGVVDRLREQGYRVVAFNAGAGTKRTDSSGELGFADCRSAAWWNLRELLDPSAGEPVALPPDDMLTGDLTAPHWRVMSAGRVKVESKDEIRKRIGRSTDSADSVVQAFWPDDLFDDEVAEWSDGRLSGRR